MNGKLHAEYGVESSEKEGIQTWSDNLLMTGWVRRDGRICECRLYMIMYRVEQEEDKADDGRCLIWTMTKPEMCLDKSLLHVVRAPEQLLYVKSSG